MEKIITYEDLRKFTYSNDQICKQNFKGIVIEFPGLGCKTMHHEDMERGIMCAEHGIIYIIPYNNPWSWMNRQAVDFTDEVIDVIFKKYGLPDDFPIVSIGGSMGGQQALVYAAYAARTPVACVVNSPVCDMIYHFSERPDLPRTMYSSYYNYEGSLEDVLQSASPVHLAMQDKMPKIPYYVFHGSIDKSVNIDNHSRRFVEEMEKHGHNIRFHVVEGKGHCGLTDEMRALFDKYFLEAVEKQSPEKT